MRSALQGGPTIPAWFLFIKYREEILTTLENVCNRKDALKTSRTFSYVLIELS